MYLRVNEFFRSNRIKITYVEFMKIIIRISKRNARLIAMLLIIFIVEISIEYASSLSMPLQWHPLNEISANGGLTSIATASGNLNSTYLEGPVNVSSRNVTIISRNLSITGSGNGIIFPDGTMQKTAHVADNIAPAAIINLATSNPTGGSITLAWTAPGDDGNVGTASQYDIRYSTSTITNANWASATQVSGETAPKPAGSSESFTVTGLNPTTTYYFAIKTADEIPNWSGISNSPSATTLTPKKVFVTSAMYNGNLGGLSGADAKCQALANAAGLTGTFKAWLSDSTTSAKDRLTHSASGYARVDGVIVANDWNDLVSGGLRNPIQIDENGGSQDSPVLTGTSASGTHTAHNCNNWTYAADPYPYNGPDGTLSWVGAVDSSWSNSGYRACYTFSVGRLYCFQQTPPSACGATTSFQDIDGNSYNTVDIGTQCWSNQNLKVTKNPSGSAITRYCYGNDINNCNTDGGLYDWNTAMNGATAEGSQGICPAGWHVPTDTELYNLENYLKDSGQTCIASRPGIWDCATAGTKLKIGGTSGFQGILAGYTYSDGSFHYRGDSAIFWSSTKYDVNDAWNRMLQLTRDTVYRGAYFKSSASSVRCIKN